MHRAMHARLLHRLTVLLLLLVILAATGTGAVTLGGPTVANDAVTVSGPFHPCGDLPFEPSCRTLCVCALELDRNNGSAVRTENKVLFGIADEPTLAPHTAPPELAPPRLYVLA